MAKETVEYVRYMCDVCGKTLTNLPSGKIFNPRYTCEECGKWLCGRYDGQCGTKVTIRVGSELEREDILCAECLENRAQIFSRYMGGTLYEALKEKSEELKGEKEKMEKENEELNRESTKLTVENEELNEENAKLNEENRKLEKEIVEMKESGEVD